MTLRRFILAIVHVALCVVVIFSYSSCTHYVEPTGVKLTQVGGVFVLTPEGVIYINNETSFEDATDVADTGLNWWGAAKMLGISTDGDVAQAKSADDVTKTLDANRSAEAINESNNALKTAELEMLVE